MCKRFFDIVLSITGLLIVWPLMLLIGLFVYIDSPGPVIFSQKRIGRNGVYFFMHKFRKFPSNWGTKGPGVTTGGDVRMTTVGRILERTKLDELPQLWNVLIGEMSLVGPRPETEGYADLFEGRFADVHKFTPGIFGPNQVAFRNESQMFPPDSDPEQYYRDHIFQQKAENDLNYFSRANCLRDIAWIVKGLWVSLAGMIHWRRTLGIHASILITDFYLIQVANVASYILRFGLDIPGRHLESMITGVWLLPALVLPIMFIAGVYRHPVRYFSLGDAIRLMTVVTGSWIFASLVMLGFLHRGASIAVMFLGVIMTVPLLVLPRVLVRERRRRELDAKAGDECMRVIIYGAGDRGSGLLSLFKSGYPKVKVAGFVDDDENLRGRFIQSHKVHGSERDLDTLVELVRFRQLWLTFYPEEGKMRRLTEWANKHNVEVIVLPAIVPFNNLEQAISCEP